MVELLSPVGDFECLQAAVQNGADSVYLGGSAFNARASASNFDNDNLKKAIRYAKLRNVKINFALNTLVKDDEFEDAVKLAEYVYSLGADAIIVQDLGLAKYIINNMPGMDVHGSTQMTIHNLQGVLALEKMGFKRVVLSRELSLSEIEYICNNSNVEIEVFAHGALCISYSGQCLLSSTIGARSGNRGRCAQPCRLPYELIDDKNQLLETGELTYKIRLYSDDYSDGYELLEIVDDPFSIGDICVFSYGIFLWGHVSEWVCGLANTMDGLISYGDHIDSYDLEKKAPTLYMLLQNARQKRLDCGALFLIPGKSFFLCQYSPDLSDAEQEKLHRNCRQTVYRAMDEAERYSEHLVLTRRKEEKRKDDSSSGFIGRYTLMECIRTLLS